MSGIILLISMIRFLPAAGDAGHFPPAESRVAAVAGNAAGQGAAQDEAAVAVPAPSEKAVRYYRSGNLLWLVKRAWNFLVPVLFLFTGLSARIRSRAQRFGKSWFMTIGGYFVLYLFLNFLLNLPLSYYGGFIREHAYGLSTQTAAKWWTDAWKGLGVNAAGGILLLWIPYLILRRSPKRWWLYTGLLSLPFLMLVIMIAPVWIDPLFNHYEALKNRELDAKILALADRAGIEGSRVFEVDKSADTSTVNAYVTGFLGTKRIVFWDTILAKLNERELMVVMAHEMGHYVLGHIMKGMMLAFFMIIAGLFLVHRLARILIERFRHRFGFDRLSDVASLPLLILLTGTISFAVSPFSLAVSRHFEHEADRFALDLTHDNHAAATAFVKLQEENLAIPRPGPVYRLLRASHPSLGERIDFCNEYHPWRNEKAGRDSAETGGARVGPLLSLRGP
jgi:STE24 endopeptidase